MGVEVLFAAVIVLALFAIFDLVVGVSNDAVNFLNSSIGSRAAPRYVIMIVASLGILAGVTFSSGMMEVARKGIFHPKFLTMPELLTIFLAVMLTDVILLDLFNTFGLPTSTTVSIVFELLGGAVALSVLKIVQSGESLAALGQYINTAKAMMIIFGILFSVVVAFFFGAVVQFLTRLLFTFDFQKRIKRYGALWGGVALACITYFILVKGAKGTSFLTSDAVTWIKTHTFQILLWIFIVSAILLQILIAFRINILKPIVLIGTFALAMAFAANDLVNFIGVPMAGYHAYELAAASSSPLTMTMGGLAKKVPSETLLLLLAGAVMTVTLWISRKARTVTQTSLDLGQQEEGEERFDSSLLSRAIVRVFLSISQTVNNAVPGFVRNWIAHRFDATKYLANIDADNRTSFDLIRASVNLMVAGAVISYATSKKLPLSTTYVTFMVAMGTSFADLAWGRESAVYRVSGVLTVIGGWFMTALSAFVICAIFTSTIHFLGMWGAFALLIVVGFIVWRTHHVHKGRETQVEGEKVFSITEGKDIPGTLALTFKHMSYLLREIRQSLDRALDALFAQNDYMLRAEGRDAKRIQRWANIVIANALKSMRLLQQEKDPEGSFKYPQIIRRVQKLADGHRDIVQRANLHVRNHHKGLLPVQVEELRKVQASLHDTLADLEEVFTQKRPAQASKVKENNTRLRALAKDLNEVQTKRIQTVESKTRLTILYYAIIGNAMMLSKQCARLLDISQESFGPAGETAQFDLD